MKAVKKKPETELRYFQVGMKHQPADWRDSSLIVATKDLQLSKEIHKQFQLPVARRKMVGGSLLRFSGGYNKNADHEFLWRLKEDEWGLIDVSIEIYDGSPYSGVDADTAYWLNTMKRFTPWNSYIAREIKP
ncbi:MAG: BP74-related protein [Chitinophagaceae bacterium]